MEKLFRGQLTKNNGQLNTFGKVWVYGRTIPLKNNNDVCTIISNEEYEVYANTFSQFTGSVDRNRTKIFQGDIVKDSDGHTYEVVYEGTRTPWYLEGKWHRCPMTMCDMSTFEIVGNVWDTPKLLKEIVCGGRRKDEILFRGKITNNKDWMYSRCPDGVLNSNTIVEQFLPETVGQFTGILDRTGQKIFEGDVIRFYTPPNYYVGHFAFVFYERGEFRYKSLTKETEEIKISARRLSGKGHLCKVVDNVYDNPKRVERVLGTSWRTLLNHEVLFRGKRTDTKTWDYSRYPDGMLQSGVITKDFIFETFGEYTGLKDRSGKKIFEGDIVKFATSHGEYYGQLALVVFEEGEFRFTPITEGKKIWTPLIHRGYLTCKVVTNIHDDLEMVKRAVYDKSRGVVLI